MFRSNLKLEGVDPVQFQIISDVESGCYKWMAYCNVSGSHALVECSKLRVFDEW